MKNLFMRVLAFVIVLTMIFSVATIGLSANADEYDKPVIVINGIENNPLYANPGTTGATQLFPPEDLTMYAMTTQMFIDGIVSIASNEYEEVMNFFAGSQVFGMLEPIQLNADGTSMSENVGPIIYNRALSYYSTDVERFELIAGQIGMGMCDKLGADNVYVFNYDWRIDPIENARGLHDFIQTVKQNSRKDQVSIISEGFGSTVATTYLAECYEEAIADVDNFVTVNSAFMGTSLIGDLFTGRLIRQNNELQNATSAFVRFVNDISDNPATWFASWLSLYILNKNWEIQDFVASNITMMGHIVDPLYDDYLRDMLKNFTGLWAMVPVEYFEDAVNFMFSDNYNKDYKKTLQTFKNYQASAEEILTKAKSEGVNINVVSSWDVQIIPIGDNKASEDELFGLSAQSDGLIDTYYSSFGCYTIPLNDVGAAAQNKDQRNTEGECANHNHLNAVYDTLNPEGSLGAICHYLDASTCALPDNTWFIRNMKHGTFDTASNAMNFLTYLITADKTLTVYSANGLYRQFMFYNRYVKPGYLDVADIPNDPGTYLLGDIDSDEYITSADARLALRISARLENYPDAGSVVFMNADVNADGKITASDARSILRVSAMLEEDTSHCRTNLDDKRSDSTKIIMSCERILDDIVITVSAKNMSGLQNANLFFDYDEKYLKFVSIAKCVDADYDLGAGGSVSAGKASWGFAYLEDANSDTDIVIIRFKALKNGSSTISCTVGTWDGTAVPKTCSIDVTNKPAAQETTTKKPVSQETTTKKPVSQETTTKKPAVQENPTKKPVEETTTKKPVVEENTTKNPTTQAPTTKVPSTAEPTVNNKLEVKKNSGINVDALNKISTINVNNTVKELSKNIENKKFSVVDKNGKDFDENTFVGTGSKIQIKNNSGKVISEYQILVLADVDGNGKITAADARLALRCSAKLDELNGVYEMAADITGDTKLTAADARKILRKSAKIE